MKDVLERLDEMEENRKNNPKYDGLKLENQICFPIYVSSRFITTKYKKLLVGLNLTYTQYVTMLAIWEYGESTVSELGNHLFLDSGTLTPVLKTLESKKLIKRTHSKEDERNVIIKLTEKGMDLKDRALTIPNELNESLKLNEDEREELYELLYKLLGGKTAEECGM